MKINGLTPTQVTLILGVSRSRVRQFVRDGDLKTEGTFGNTTIFSKHAVEALKKKRDEKKAIRDAKKAKKNGRPGTPPPQWRGTEARD